MAKITVQGTEFTLSVLPLRLFSTGFWARTQIVLKNEYVSYDKITENISRDELEEWIFCMFRLLAGAYRTEYTLSFEKSGFAVDLYPYTKDGAEATREERRQHDCVMAVRFLMSASDETFLGGVYTLLFHREEIETFAASLRSEFDAVFAKRKRSKGKYLFVGVSPLGYVGCNYWYLDPTKTVRAGEYVWAHMGRHNLKQIVYVDSVKYCNDDTSPYDPERVKRVLGKATPEELEIALKK